MKTLPKQIKTVIRNEGLKAHSSKVNAEIVK
jgi:hypothetical protein